MNKMIHFFLKPPILLPFLIALFTAKTDAIGQQCNQLLSSKCSCGRGYYLDEREQVFLVNCTNTLYNDTKSLENLPEDVEVLIFTGNNLQTLPWNVFGTLTNYPKLRVVDMSNNKIHEIRGKTFHHVTNVERLILNYNNILISDDDRVSHHHPRVFSNFINLQELHLTNAFADNSKNLAADLHDIFVNSNLVKLQKIHLEQNEIEKFEDRQVFCDLPQIMDLYLGDNLIESLDLELNCMKRLRFIDLERNRISQLREEDRRRLDAVAQQNGDFMIDLTENPFLCGCHFNQLTDWVKNSIQNSSRVQVRRPERLKCHHNETIKDDCFRLTASSEVNQDFNEYALATVLGLLTTLLVVLLAIYIFNKRKSLRYRISPIVQSVSRRVYYSSIGHSDDQEVAV